MHPHLKRTVVFTVVGALSGTALYALLVAVNGGPDALYACMTRTPYSWVLPFLAVLVILVSAWILLGQTPKSEEDGPMMGQMVCPRCFSGVSSEWRLCPYCGSRLGGDEQVLVSGTGAAEG